jgi:hypothetical protein
MGWKIVITNQSGEELIEPEGFSDRYLAYRRANEIKNGDINFKDFIPTGAISGEHCFNLFIYVLLNDEEPELFMERRGFIAYNETETMVEWRDRHEDELPFRITIMPDYGAYAWDEYRMDWSVNCGFSDDKIADELHEDFLSWLAIFENTDIGKYGIPIINFCWQEFHQKGLALAQRLKMLGKDNIVVFYERPYEDTFIVEDIRLIKIHE